MPAEHGYLGLRQGVKPEKFVYITLTPDYSSLIRVSKDMTEDELWAFLHKQGVLDDEIRSLIEAARNNPV